MTETTKGAVVGRTMTVPLDRERAFELFTAGIGSWWPAQTGHHLSDLPATAMMETCEDGRLHERDAQDREFDWGRVRVREPPRRVVLAWHLTPEWRFDPDPGVATEVELVFGETSDGLTRVDFEHRGFEIHGRPGLQLRDALAADDGWPEVLSRYERAAA